MFSVYTNASVIQQQAA